MSARSRRYTLIWTFLLQNASTDVGDGDGWVHRRFHCHVGGLQIQNYFVTSNITFMDRNLMEILTFLYCCLWQASCEGLAMLLG